MDGEKICIWDFLTFKGPSPPYGSHRYGFFLFRQFEGKYRAHQIQQPIQILQPIVFDEKSKKIQIWFNLLENLGF